MRGSLPCLAVVPWLLSIACATTAAQGPADAGVARAYPIKLHRAANIGDRLAQTTTLKVTQSVAQRAGDAVLSERRDTIELSFVATLEVLDVAANGEPARTQYAIDRCTIATPDGPQTIAASGTSFIITRGAEPSPFTMVSGELTSEAQNLINLILATDTPDTTDDEVFGTTTAQAVGGTWPINNEKTAADFRSVGIHVDAAGLSGGAKLVGVTTVDGAEYLEVQAEIIAKDFTPPQMPPGATLRRSEMRTVLAGVYPADPTRERLQDSAQVSANVLLDQTVDGKPVQTEMILEQEQRTTYGAVAPSAS